MANGGEDGQVWRLHGVALSSLIQLTLRMHNDMCVYVHAHIAFLKRQKTLNILEPSKDYHCQGDCVLQSIPFRSRAVILPCLCSFECLHYLIRHGAPLQDFDH